MSMRCRSIAGVVLTVPAEKEVPLPTLGPIDVPLSQRNSSPGAHNIT